MTAPITQSYPFYPAEVWLWRDGEEAFVRMITRAVTMKMEAADAFGPFAYWVEDLGHSDMRVIRASEI